MAQTPDPVSGYVRTDEYGVMRVGRKISLDSVVYAFREGAAPETIRREYPLLTLEQVYGAIAYYLAHQREVDEYLLKQEAVWAKLRAAQDRNPSPVVQRLRALKAAQAAGPRP